MHSDRDVGFDNAKIIGLYTWFDISVTTYFEKRPPTELNPLNLKIIIILPISTVGFTFFTKLYKSIPSMSFSSLANLLIASKFIYSSLKFYLCLEINPSLSST